jgi:hypothetical protein
MGSAMSVVAQCHRAEWRLELDRDALMQEVVGLRAKPNVAERDQGVADFYRPREAVEGRGGGRPVVVVRHQIVSWLQEGRRQDGLCFTRGKGEDSMVLWLLDFLV